MKFIFSFIFLAFIGSMVQGQIIDSFPWYKLDKIPGLNGNFKLTGKEAYKELVFVKKVARIRNESRYKKKFGAWENSIAKGQGGSLLSAEMVKSARSKHSEDSSKDLLARHAIYLQRLHSKIEDKK